MSETATIERQASSLGEVLDHAIEAEDEWSRASGSAEVWYRGVARAHFGLQPSIYRPGCDGLVEEDLLSRFTAQSVRFLETRPANEWELYFLAQHYGLPTRLLDWTENVAMAVYFALSREMEAQDRTYSRVQAERKKEPEQPGLVFDDDSPAVWMIDAGWVNRVTVGPDDDRPITPGGGFTEHWLQEHVERGEEKPFEYRGKTYTNRRPLAILPVHRNPRITAQQGAFTVHGADPAPLERLLLEDAPTERMIRKVVLDSSRKYTMWSELVTLGVHVLSVFPELASVAELLKRSQR
jgi:hypothetical protein